MPDLGVGVAASIHVPKEYVISIYESKNYQGRARSFYHPLPAFAEEFYEGLQKSGGYPAPSCMIRRLGGMKA